MSIDIKPDEAKKMLAEVAGIYPKVTYRAINKSLAKTKTAASAAIRDQVNLSARYVRDKLMIQQASLNNLSGKVYAYKRGILLSRFAPNLLMRAATSPSTQLKGWPGMSDESVSFPAIPAGSALKQISIKIRTGGSRIKGKFFPIRLDNSKAVGLAVRTGYTAGKGQANREKNRALYKVLYGPSVSQVYSRLKEPLEQGAATEYLIQFEAQLNHELSKLSK